MNRGVQFTHRYGKHLKVHVFFFTPINTILLAVVGLGVLIVNGLAAAAKVLFKLRNQIGQVFVADELCSLSGRDTVPVICKKRY